MKAASAGVEDTQLRTHNIAVCATQLDQSALSLSLSLSLCVCVSVGLYMLLLLLLLHAAVRTRYR